ncbi:tegument protein VP13/14 [Cervid alphaherpesvirus 2]|uniref:Tegument protein UL47 n=1 Tax=Cervid alphaherpesvirus 2 TaxID=365327 RepID=A0A455JL91_9ALPH|nr:tegument protein VP13/14 [Cervid alphaherpesvirus 2]AVT50733.1 tegument protein VP13/14 [Cervid alphaherpesvirus 2]
MDVTGAGGAPVRRPRRSGNYRAHPFERPRARRSLLDALRAADAAAAERPRAPPPRPRPDFQPPPDEETSEDEDAYGGGDDDYDSDDFGASPERDWGQDEDEDGMDVGELPGHDPAPEAAEPRDYLTGHLRALESLPASAPHRRLVERAAQRAYARRFPPRDPGAGSAAPAQRARRSLRGPPPRGAGGAGGPDAASARPRDWREGSAGGDDEDEDAEEAAALEAADLREDPAPDAAYAHLERDERLAGAPWLPGVEAAAEAAEDEAMLELFTHAPQAPAPELPLPAALEGRMRPRAFFARMPLDALCLAPSAARATRELRAWEMGSSAHGLLVTAWGTIAPEFSAGGMYVGAPEDARPWLAWRRALKQAMALQHRLGAGALCQALDDAGATPAEAALFLADALVRVGRNCHLLSRPGRAGGAARRLPAAAAGPLAATQFTPPDASARAALFRGALGTLIHWPALRAALTAVPAVCARRAGAALQAAEVYLLAQAHARAPGYTAEERCAASAYLSLFVALAERALRWLYLAGAHLLGPRPTAAAFREVRAKAPYARLPLGSAALHDAEVETAAPAAFQEALGSSALAQAYGEAYVALRTSATLLMAEFATRVGRGEAREATAAFLGVGLIAQRLLGSLNLLLNCLAGAAVYGGRRVAVREGTLERYSLLADAALPLVRPLCLVEFWEAREELMRELRLRPVAGPPAAGKRRLVELYPSLEGMDALAGREALSARPALGPPADIAEALAEHPHLVTGDRRAGGAPRLGAR